MGTGGVGSKESVTHGAGSRDSLGVLAWATVALWGRTNHYGGSCDGGQVNF